MYYFPKKLGGPNALLAPPFHSLGGPWPPWPPPWRTPWYIYIYIWLRTEKAIKLWTWILVPGAKIQESEFYHHFALVIIEIERDGERERVQDQLIKRFSPNDFAFFVRLQNFKMVKGVLKLDLTIQLQLMIWLVELQ